MELYLVPVPRGGYELYFEPRHDDEDGLAGADEGGWFAGLRRRFQDMLREAEDELHNGGSAPPAAGLWTRARRQMMRWIATRVMEQRMLWHLRTAPAVTVHVPGDLPEPEAQRIVRQMMQLDADRHLRWMLVHMVGLALSAPLAFIPGPNLFGYFFTFTVVGHFLAMRGARHGLSGVRWTMRPSPPLEQLRAALAARGADRRRIVTGVADALRLQRLASFFERIAIPTA
ncbi:MAG: hypothetical protein AB1635_21735 [Acidobacteriota bacterium]